jgi:ubiquinone/menaquinone biosynthesis C-methylase UbiE
MVSRATQAELLEKRIAENVVSQEIDLAAWIFERVRMQPGFRVLELCCGTGGQTLPLLERVGEAGHVVAVDISRGALSTLASKAAAVDRDRLATVEASLDSFSPALREAGFLQGGGFDLIFCAYGLYYAADARQVLNEARGWLNPQGSIVVVGPFGPNNKPLFDLLRSSGVALSEPVTFSSERFMSEVVVPWAAENFERTFVHTMVNRVHWSTPERVLNYWQNTTFYDAEKRARFEELLHSHFTEHGAFVNKKWVMLVEMSHGR